MIYYYNFIGLDVISKIETLKNIFYEQNNTRIFIAKLKKKNIYKFR